MMTEKVKKQLQQKEMTPFHTALRDQVLSLVSRSRADMGEYYDEWDRRHKTYRAEKEPSAADKKNAEVKEPKKCIVPLTYAQVDTFVSFSLMTLMQRKNVFEFEATGMEDFEKDTPAETLLHRDMVKSKQVYLLNQLLVDIGKFGLGAIKCCWSEEFDYVPVQEPDQPEEVIGGVVIKEATTRTRWKKIKTWSGNKLHNVSPFRLFPDTRLPLTKYQEGEFFAIEEETTFSQLRWYQPRGTLLLREDAEAR
jgi:hypothetical protein